MSFRGILIMFTIACVLFFGGAAMRKATEDDRVAYKEWHRSKYECDILIFEENIFDLTFEEWEHSLKHDSCDVEVGHE